MENDYKTIFNADLMEAVKATCNYPWAHYIPPFEVVSGVYYVSGIAFVACYLIDTGDGLVLIDTAFHESVYLVVDAIYRLGYQMEDLKAIFLSHLHFDHANGARALQELSHAKLYMSRADLGHLNNSCLMYNDGSLIYGTLYPDCFYEDKPEICIGKIVFHTVPTPGHTPGTTSFFFTVQDEEYGLLQVAMHGGLGLNTMGEDYLRQNGLPQSLQQSYLQSLRTLREWQVDVCIPSHASHYDILALREQKSKDYNPFINREIWPDLLTRFEKQFLEMKQMK